MRNERGFTLVELLVAMAVSTIVIGGTYSTYTLVSNQYEKIKETGEIHYSANQVMQIVSRDIRMAGYTNRDFNSAYTKIPRSDAVSIEDNGDTCCDALNVQYDREINGKVKRVWTRYFTKNERGRNRLYKTEKIKQGNSWVSLHNPTDQLLVDRVTNLQLTNNVDIGNIYHISLNRNIFRVDANTGAVDNKWPTVRYQARPKGYYYGSSVYVDPDTSEPAFIGLTLSLHSKKKYKNKYRQAELSTSVTARNLALVEQ